MKTVPFALDLIASVDGNIVRNRLAPADAYANPTPENIQVELGLIAKNNELIDQAMTQYQAGQCSEDEARLATQFMAVLNKGGMASAIEVLRDGRLEAVSVLTAAGAFVAGCKR